MNDKPITTYSNELNNKLSLFINFVILYDIYPPNQNDIDNNKKVCKRDIF